MGDSKLVEKTARLARVLPDWAVSSLAKNLDSLPENASWPYRRIRVMDSAPQAWVRSLLSSWLTVWETCELVAPPAGLAFALRTATLAAQQERQAQQVELVWTGPDASVVGLRRTEQALLQVIEAAQDTLLIVSFAVYRIATISQALIEATRRGVAVRICLESPEEAGAQIAYDTVRALGPDVAQHATIYVWPREQRPVAPNGNVGVLHAKCAVADDRLLFISSANLTQYAMNLNVELGVLIEGGELPARVAAQFDGLIEKGILKAVAA